MPITHLVLTRDRQPRPPGTLASLLDALEGWARPLDVGGGVIGDGERLLLWLEGRYAAVHALRTQIDATGPMAPAIGVALGARWQLRDEWQPPLAPRWRTLRAAEVSPTLYDALDALLSAGGLAACLDPLQRLLGDPSA